MKQGYSTYQTANVDTADQGKLIIIAYDVAIKHCRLAVEIIDDRARVEELARHLIKVQDAITELMSSLRFDVGGEIARNLYRIYEYMLWRIVNANIKRERIYVEEVQRYLVDLREAWKEAVQKVKSENNLQEMKPGTVAMNV